MNKVELIGFYGNDLICFTKVNLLHLRNKN
jgi:hypothetical protein